MELKPSLYVSTRGGIQPGGDLIRNSGVRVESLAIIDGMSAEDGKITFRN